MFRKKIITFALLLVMLMTIFAMPITASAAVYDEKTKANSEFGTITGMLSGGLVFDRKEVSYMTSTTKTATIIIAELEACLYSTGKVISSDEIATQYNAKYAGYTWECHSPTYNTQKMSAYGSHEARGQGSLGVYTAIINF